MTARLWLGLPNRDGSLPGHAQRLYDAGQIAGAMVSAGALFEGGRFHELGCVYDDLPVVLDSAGFVAATKGGYRWTAEQYVEHVGERRIYADALSARPARCHSAEAAPGAPTPGEARRARGALPP